MSTNLFAPATFQPAAASGAYSDFRTDARFAAAMVFTDIVPAGDAALIEPPALPPDSYALGWAEGHAAALAEAQLEIARLRAADTAERDAMRLALTRIDAMLEARLAARLRDTVAALCEASLAPLALDPEALARRVECAAAMLASADSERVVWLNPNDLALLAPRFGDALVLHADATLARGAVRVEGTEGGVEDGPAQWSAAIECALRALAVQAECPC